MTLLEITIGIPVLIIDVVTAVDIIRRHLGAARTAGWLLIVLILPLIGAVLYWALRKSSPAEVQVQHDAELAVMEERRRRPVGGTGLRR
jgi:hypothetical protein